MAAESCRQLGGGCCMLLLGGGCCCMRGRSPARVRVALDGLPAPGRVRRGTTQCCTHGHVMPHHQRVAVSPKVVVPHLAGSAWTSLATALFPPSGRQKLGGRKRGGSQVESLQSPGLVILAGIGFTRHQVNINFWSSEY